MTQIYICMICEKESKQLSHHKKHLTSEKHIIKKHLKFNELVRQGFSEAEALEFLKYTETVDNKSQFCIVDNTVVPIQEYIDNFIKYQGKEIYNLQGNELILCHGKKVKPYFRRFYPSEMTAWHKEWQDYFSEYTEVVFKKQNNMNKSRRTDVDLNLTTVIEFQHSFISKKEVIEREHDYKLLGKRPIWVIDGNTDDICIDKSLYCDKIHLEFCSHLWKYQSFLDCDMIYIDINGEIYRINPKNVKSAMICINPPVSKDDFILFLKENHKIFPDNLPCQIQLYIKQMGAGNGKTYTICQLLKEPNPYTTFIYLLKAHSAKEVLFKELNEQIENKQLNNIEFNEDDLEIVNNPENKDNKYVIRFCKKDSSEEQKLIICTIDSLMYRLGKDEGVSKYVDCFIQNLNNIINEESLNKCCGTDGRITFAKQNIKLNMKTLILIDESQELNELYGKAIVKIMWERYVHFYLCGDIMQSMKLTENLLTFFNDFSSDETINITKFDPVNINRRTTSKKIKNFINSVVNFKKYNLPQIELYKEEEVCKKTFNGEESIEFITAESHHNLYNDNNVLQNEVNKLMKRYKYEVETNGRIEKDFLIVALFVSRNILLEAFNTAVREFWLKKEMKQVERIADDDFEDKLITYETTKTCYLHQAEEIGSINTRDSKNSTRIVSTHTALGDGRKVVFVIGFTEYGLKKYSFETGNLVYESLWHVALTRVIETLYLQVVYNGDDLHQRIHKYQQNSNLDITVNPPPLCISKKVQIKELTLDPYYKECYNEIISKSKQKDFNSYIDDCVNIENSNQENIDMKHHNIRYQIMNVLSWLLTIEKQSRTVKKQNYALLKGITKRKIKPCSTYSEYYKSIIELQYNKEEKNNKYIPILKYTSKCYDYQRYYDKIETIINENIKFLDDFIKYPQDNPEKYKDYLNNPENCIVLNYMFELEVKKQYTKFHICNLYDILHVFDSFTEKTREEFSKKHYEMLSYIDQVWSVIYERFDSLSILWNQRFGFGNDLELFTYKIVGYNKDDCIIFYLKPQFNELNFNTVCLDSIFDTLLFENNKDTIEKFQNKRIQTCIITFAKEPYYIKWNDDNNNDLINLNDSFLKGILHDTMTNYFEKYNNDVISFYKYHRNKRKNISFNSLIKAITESLKTLKPEPPSYISKCFDYIEREVRHSKTKKDTIKYYDDKLNLDTVINEELKVSLNNLLEIDYEEEDYEED